MAHGRKGKGTVRWHRELAHRERGDPRGVASLLENLNPPAKKPKRFVRSNYLGKQNFLPLHVGDVATINEPVLVLATALIVLLPNLAARTFLQEAGEAV
jgi:hypothetical protein